MWRFVSWVARPSGICSASDILVFSLARVCIPGQTSPEQRGFKEMAAPEGKELTALERNLVYIMDYFVGDLQRIAFELVAKGFIPQRRAHGILTTRGVDPLVQADQLMHYVFVKIRVTDEKRCWFLKFVDIFSHDEAYGELVKKLMKGTYVRGLLSRNYSRHNTFSLLTTLGVYHLMHRVFSHWQIEAADERITSSIPI